MIRRRTFLELALAALPLSLRATTIPEPKSIPFEGKVVTVNGAIAPEALSTTLIHEHILVDFSGYAQYDPTRWNDDDVVQKMLPFLKELKEAGCRSLIDCTPNFLGRDPLLLSRLSKLSGLHIITNTGYYGGSDNKYLPPQAFSETAEQLAARWIRETTEGLDGTKIYPGFIKISVNPGPLSEVSRKLIAAAAMTHLQTGLTIASHTGPAVAAFEELSILQKRGVAPGAFIWVHAQNATAEEHIRAAQQGAWVSLDGLSDENTDLYVSFLSNMKKADLLSRVLISHDAGWYEPGKPNGGTVRGYTVLFKTLLPRLRASGFNDQEITQLMVINPASAFTVKVRRI
ncbi:phosphotriesterase [Chryseolinea sp. T2]|uniref:phosphotriesterase family protein n=1 Tax=Chryseolinea sp. T2 TaxID=3129255 RepID=UPI0030771530